MLANLIKSYGRCFENAQSQVYVRACECVCENIFTLEEIEKENKHSNCLVNVTWYVII